MSAKRITSVGLACCVAMVAYCSPVHAQSSVTLFGAVDVAFLYTSKTRNSKTGLNEGEQFSMIDGGSSYSQFGLTGSEDLGEGISAKFRLQSAFTANNGDLVHCNGNLFGCEAWVGLSGPRGDIKLGLQFSPFFLAVYDSDARDLSLFGSGAIPYVGTVFGTGIFTPNSISYSSPVFNGFKVSALFSFGGKAGDFSAGRQYSASIRYHMGGLTVNAALFSANGGGVTSTSVPTDVEFTGRMLGVAYQFGSLTAKMSFVNYKVAGSFNNNVYSGGVSWLVTPAFAANGGVWVVSDRNRTANNSIMIAIGSDYFLSKSTSIYAQLGMVNNRGEMNTGLSIIGALNGVRGTTFGGVLGIKKMF
ncbi:porin [Burkholderia sp. Ac-20353]|uniref:porin n=1 Tax=Burkholderia sp. Ac-20353 TaxID=2703894 RepID=UPI00197B7EE4|nr:porin [Burkholderia sp. Ac-20353]MBN3788825.1 porin [Burkholderia sp. Ac-20353]